MKTEEIDSGFLDSLPHECWLWALRGLLALMFSVIAFTRPDITIWALAILWGVFAIADGLAGHNGSGTYITLLPPGRYGPVDINL
jgi:uncharacterized membrane protein HdeD (DUF308 family)